MSDELVIVAGAVARKGKKILAEFDTLLWEDATTQASLEEQVMASLPPQEKNALQRELVSQIAQVLYRQRKIIRWENAVAGAGRLAARHQQPPRAGHIVGQLSPSVLIEKAQILRAQKGLLEWVMNHIAPQLLQKHPKFEQFAWAYAIPDKIDIKLDASLKKDTLLQVAIHGSEIGAKWEEAIGMRSQYLNFLPNNGWLASSYCTPFAPIENMASESCAITYQDDCLSLATFLLANLKQFEEWLLSPHAKHEIERTEEGLGYQKANLKELRAHDDHLRKQLTMLLDQYEASLKLRF